MSNDMFGRSLQKYLDTNAIQLGRLNQDNKILGICNKILNKRVAPMKKRYMRGNGFLRIKH